jgi:hypothetical protein
MSSRIFDILTAIQAAFGVIQVANGYNTDIGTSIVLYDQQRAGIARPSISIAARDGKIDLRAESAPSGGFYSKFYRQMDFVMEAGINAAPEDAERLAHDALEDIEKVYAAILKDNNAMPAGTSRFSLTSWSIPDPPDGIDAAVLQIIGVVDYLRTPT